MFSNKLQRWFWWGSAGAVVVLLVLFMADFVASWKVSYEQYYQSKLFSRIAIGMTETEVESILGQKAKPYANLGRLGTKRPGGRMVCWQGQGSPNALIAVVDVDGRIVDRTLPYKAKPEETVSDRIHAWLGW
jgi:hypothetical protein